LELLAWQRQGRIRQTRRLADEIDDIHPEPIDALVQPENHDVVDSSHDVWVFPVEIRLFFAEQVQIVLAGLLVKRPRTA
jgi:hypothetical protein